MKAYSFLLFSCFLFLHSLFLSQNYLGVATSNYAGAMGTQLQPASFVDGRFVFDWNLFGLNQNLYQNFGYFDANAMRQVQGDGGYWWKQSFGDTAIFNYWSKPDSTFLDRFVVRNYTKDSKKVLGLYSQTQADLFNLNFHVSPKVAIGLFARYRSITNIDNMDPKLAILAENGLDYSLLWNQKLNEELININHLTWGEFGFNYGQVVIDQKEHFLKAGGSLKLLSGVAGAYFYTNNFSYNLKNEDTSFSLEGDFNYGYSQNIDNFIVAPPVAPLDYLKRASNWGLGVDLGVVYEWRQGYQNYQYDMDGKTGIWARYKNKYKLRIGASLLDLGAMRFKKGGLSRNFSVNSNNPFDLTVFQSAGNLNEFDQVIDSLINNPDQEWVSAQSTGSMFNMRTPSALSLQIDYHLWRPFYINATAMMNLIGKKTDTKVKAPSQFSVTPSIDFAGFGLHFPVSYNTYSGLKAGLATRLGPLTVGITDYRTLFARGKIAGLEFFTGLRIPVLYQEVEDDDRDKVSNKLDDCPDQPGTWAFKGCADTDGDGIKDSEDQCVTVPGLKEFNGCPDRDGDKIMDQLDDCPDLAGLKEFNGCPDTDGDKVIDTKDQCPTVPGMLYLKGCPDRDNDSITDMEDLCPDKYGTREGSGCPDSDKDGLYDFADECPLVVGPQENNGCPWPDSDGDGTLDRNDGCPDLVGPKENGGCPYKDSDNDGILDKDDACPTNFGKKEYNGCPDSDNDGIIDMMDACPTSFGPKENNGCPYKDSDGDGLLDKDDQCPNLFGPKENEGCPYKDTDADGLLDKDDQCPNTPGPIANNGCPVIEKEVEEILKTAFDNLEFEFSKDIILAGSYKSLDELASVLNKKPTWKLEIAGHTDNVGNDANNMLLSKKRAEAVRNYLTLGGGIDADRFIVKFYGETKPIADNSTPEGRSKNRRVEMKIVFE